jgi:hypothetical protein
MTKHLLLYFAGLTMLYFVPPTEVNMSCFQAKPTSSRGECDSLLIPLAEMLASTIELPVFFYWP